MTGGLNELGAAEGVRRVRDGRLRVVDWAQDCLDRALTREPEVMAWSYLDAERVMEEAAALDRQAVKGPLHGLPIGIKDVLLTRDMPTRYNFEPYRAFWPEIDAASVTELRTAGALIFGKTHTVEFAATGAPPPTCNPHDPTRTPGGSSSGSAAAVADFHVPIAMATQTGGSLIRPSAFCGVHGFKPSWGLVSTEGAKQFSVSLDTIGWMARSVEDIALIFSLLARHDIRLPRPSSLVGARIGICRTELWEQAEASSQAALIEAGAALSAAGAALSDFSLPTACDGLADCHLLIMRTEGGRAFSAELARWGERLHPSLRDMVENRDGVTAQQLCQAYDRAAAARLSFDAAAAAYDGILTLSSVGEAPVGLAATGALTFNGLWTLLHVPCLHLPAGRGPSGMPLGVTLTGRRFSDGAILALGQQIAAALRDCS